MSKSIKITKAPTFAEKRKLLFGKDVSAETLDACGDFLVGEGRLEESLEFYEKSKNADKLRGVLGTAVQEGDVCLFLRAKKLLKENATPQEWEKIAWNAAGAGKLRFALTAYERAGNAAKVEELKAKIQQTKTA